MDPGEVRQQRSPLAVGNPSWGTKLNMPSSSSGARWARSSYSAGSIATTGPRVPASRRNTSTYGASRCTVPAHLAPPARARSAACCSATARACGDGTGAGLSTRSPPDDADLLGRRPRQRATLSDSWSAIEAPAAGVEDGCAARRARKSSDTLEYGAPACMRQGGQPG